MKVFIAGATGRVAEVTIKHLIQLGHQVTAGARQPERVNPLERVTAVKLDLHASINELSEIVKNHDAIYFLAGSRGKDLLQTDAFGATKLMQAAEASGIKRFILLSSIFATEPEKWSDPNLRHITDYNIAKYFADQWLIQNTNLDYTIVQPGNLIASETGSGKIELNVRKSQPNTIPNVAEVLSTILDKENTYRQIIQMSDGDTPIAQAIATI
ncbi:NAD(P)H-binding protein [Streptococcus cuniculi]|uniref:NAD-dependent epimerase/dehydratase family protein n=1 Tax=Streptococcus cuniculi TaxID=1432788 RepID=A0A4Y9JBC5_9STRE|nr:NAD(P)H-binding protein [Streptococcus cuniculi]MBF0777681.1 NAD(P)H-binding protein [Streptococcus cuniculi]TFU98320.1 NAD-dependent epimerase/dehydratase family protein [Streptococcus cuniculi]